MTGAADQGGRVLLRPSYLAVATVVLTCVACDPARPPGSDDARAAVESTLVAFNAALADGDTGRIRTLTTPRFTLVQDGKVYDQDGAIALVAELFGTRGRMQRALGPITVTMAGENARARYLVRGSYAVSGQEEQFVRREAATLVFADGHWRLTEMSSEAQPADSSRGGT